MQANLNFIGTWKLKKSELHAVLISKCDYVSPITKRKIRAYVGMIQYNTLSNPFVPALWDERGNNIGNPEHDIQERVVEKS